ncbi:hypothetical protein TRIUR3_01339 [Triticum urartu]|uniref:Uncharacterized protein n=1 Tax=Triticum urartu TaxID=4572 RepID=M7YKU9_TRIUA|nr:hypothetical protein TRIUR3_01339 [Triticum urartu]
MAIPINPSSMEQHGLRQKGGDSRRPCGGTTPRSSASLPSLSLVATVHAAALRLGAVLEPSRIHACSAGGVPDSSRSVFDELPRSGQRHARARAVPAGLQKLQCIADG